MKKLLKSRICGSLNSAQIHCSQLNWSNSAAEKKKKKKTGKRNIVFQPLSAQSKRPLRKLTKRANSP